MTLDEPQGSLDQSLEEDKSVVHFTHCRFPRHQSNLACHRSSNNFKILLAFVSGQAALIREQMGKSSARSEVKDKGYVIRDGNDTFYICIDTVMYERRRASINP